MPQINYVTITNDFIKDGFFSEYLPPVFSIHNSFDPCSISLSSTADLVAPLSFNMSRFGQNIAECLEICKTKIEKDLSENSRLSEKYSFNKKT